MIINLRNWKNDIGKTLYSGTCGDTAYWSLSDTGYLVIYGTGAMNDYTNTTMPWYSYLSSITNSIIIGVTYIGNNVFYSCASLVSVTISDSVTSIGGSVFRNCTSLKSVTIPDSVTSIGSGAFLDSYSITSITFNGSQPTLGSSSFSLGNSTHPSTATVYSSGWANATVFTSTIIGSYTTLSYVTV